MIEEVIYDKLPFRSLTTAENAQNAANIAAYTNNLQQMQQLTDSIQTTANNELFATQELDMGAKQIASCSSCSEGSTGTANKNRSPERLHFLAA